MGKGQAFADAIIRDYRTAAITPAEVALLDYAVKLTRAPATVCEADIVRLREHGWTDEQIVNANMVASYFNFINRVADGLGIDLEPEMLGMEPLGPCPW